MPRLPSILRAVPRASLARMRRRLRCAASYLWYASIYGACARGLGGGTPDAFDGLMRTLARRLDGGGGGAGTSRSALAQHEQPACESV